MIGKKIEIKTENRTERGKVLISFLNRAKNIDALHGQKMNQIFNDEEKKRGFINSLDVDSLIELLNGINGILQDKPKDQWQIDGDRVGLESALLGTEYLPPRSEDKTELLNNVLLAIKRMNKSNRDLKDLALLVSSSINALHLYSDGNGRTSRLVYSLLTEEYNNLAKDKILEQVLDRYGRDVIDVNPHFIQDFIEELIKEKNGFNKEIGGKKIVGVWSVNLAAWKLPTAKINHNIGEEKVNLFKQLLRHDHTFMFYAFFKFYKNHTAEMGQYLKEYPGWFRILIDNFLENIKPEQFDEIINNYRNFKKDYVNTLVDIVENPNKEEYQIQDGQNDAGQISLKNYFERRIKEEIGKWK